MTFTEQKITVAIGAAELAGAAAKLEFLNAWKTSAYVRIRGPHDSDLLRISDHPSTTHYGSSIVLGDLLDVAAIAYQAAEQVVNAAPPKPSRTPEQEVRLREVPWYKR